MRYQGSKAKLSSVINDIVCKNTNPNTLYIEPFGGGMNSFAYIDRPNKIACDINHYVIALWNNIQNGLLLNKDIALLMSSVSEDMYYDIKKDCINKTHKYPDWLIGYVGFACSNGSGWWNGYAHFNPNKNENHIKEAFNGTLKHYNNFKHINNAKFIHCDYTSLIIPNDSFIYCDPPYANTKGYQKNNNFDSHAFFDWCRLQIHNGVKVLISEYDAPEDFVCIYAKNMQNAMNNGAKANTKTEKLFIHKSQLNTFIL